MQITPYLNNTTVLSDSMYENITQNRPHFPFITVWHHWLGSLHICLNSNHVVSCLIIALRVACSSLASGEIVMQLWLAPTHALHSHHIILGMKQN